MTTGWGLTALSFALMLCIILACFEMDKIRGDLSRFEGCQDKTVIQPDICSIKGVYKNPNQAMKKSKISISKSDTGQ